MAYVLIVDDQEDYANALAEVLIEAGYEVAIELDTESAEASIKQRVPDLVILDVMFGGQICAGFELARAMSHYEGELKDIPVLMLTAVNAQFALGFSAADIDEDWLPVSDFLEKPVDFKVLREKVSALLQTRASGAP